MGYQTRYQEPSPPPRSSPSVVHRAAPRRRMAEARDLERQGMPRERIAVVLGVDRLPLVLDAAAAFEADRLLLTGWRADDRFLTAAALGRPRGSDRRGRC